MNEQSNNPLKPVALRTRRTFLADVGMGFTGLALGSLLTRDGHAGEAAPTGLPHFAPKAKSVIWLFMTGGVSHMESFDPKPALNKYAGKSLAQTPLKDVYQDPFVKENFRPFESGNKRSFRQKIFPLQTGYRRHGQSGIEVSDWWPHVAGCIDDIAVVRSMWTTDNDHGAQLQFHTGRHISDGYFPTIGAWVHYGLGTLNENLPQFVVMGNPIGDCCGGTQVHLANYLGAEHDGVMLNEKNPLPFGKPAGRVYRQEQAANFDLIRRLNGLSAVEYPEDPALRARIKAYEMAFRMQMSVPKIFDVRGETKTTLDAYGGGFGRQLLAARRFVEQGVRFVQVYHGGGGGRHVGCSQQPKNEPHKELQGRRQTHRDPAEGFKATRSARRDAGRLGHRVRPHARQRGHHRPRSSSLWLQLLAGRRRHQGRHRPRLD